MQAKTGITKKGKLKNHVKFHLFERAPPPWVFAFSFGITADIADVTTPNFVSIGSVAIHVYPLYKVSGSLA